VSLVSEGFELLGTLKVPALGGKTANNMPLLITAGAYTTAMVGKIKSDAGDLRFTVNSDGTGQLPIDLVTDSIADVWTKLPSVAINNLIYVWGNKPAAVKEIDTATYGKHVVWSDYSLAVHGQYDALDSSGNSTPIFSGSESPVYDSVKGVLVGPEKRIAYSSSLSPSISIVQKLEVTSFTGGLFSNGANHGFVSFSTRLNGVDKSPTLYYSNNGFEGSGFFFDTNGTARGTSDDTIGLTTPHNILQKGTFDRDSSIASYGGTWRVFLDGIKSGENGTPSNDLTANSYNGQDFSNTVYLGSHRNWPAYAVMYIRDTLLKKFADTEDYSSIESSNQNSTDGWWIATDAAGGGGENNNVNGTASDSGNRLDFTVGGGNAYATSPTLGYLLNLNTIRCESDSVYLPMNSPSGYIWGQAASNSSDREFGVFFYSGSPSIRLIIGSETTTDALTEAEVIAEYGSNVITGTFAFEVDMSTGGYAFYHNGVSFKTGTASLGNNFNSGTNFNIGARSGSNTSGDTSGGFIAPALWKIGNTRIYLDGVLTRNFVSDGVGSTWEEIENNQNALLQGFPTDGTQWEIYGPINSVNSVNVEQSNESSTTTVNENALINSVTVEQFNQSSTISADENALINSVTVEQFNQSSTISADENALINSVTVEQFNQSSTTTEQPDEPSTTTVNENALINSVNVEQSNESSTITVNESALINSVNVEQFNESSSISADQSALINSVNVEQLNESSSISVDQGTSTEVSSNINVWGPVNVWGISDTLINSVTVEQFNQSSTISADQNALINSVTVEQSNQSSTISVDENASINSVNVEQFNQSFTISVDENALINSVNVEQFNQSGTVKVTINDLSIKISVKGVKLVPNITAFTLSSNKSIYTLKEL
jgi:hypothetical protein